MKLKKCALLIAGICLSYQSLAYDKDVFVSNPYTPYVGYNSSEELYLEALQQGLLPDWQQQQQAEQIVLEIHNSLTRLFPKFMSNKAPVGVVVTQGGDIGDASARPAGLFDSSNGLVHIQEPLLADHIPLEVKIGIIAHEMAHLYLKHRNELQGPIEVYYSDASPLSKKEEWAFREWQLLSAYVGDLNATEMKGFIPPNSRFYRYLEGLITPLAEESGDLMCQTLLPASFQTIADQLYHTKPQLQSQNMKLLSSIDEFERVLNRCLAPETISYFQTSLSLYYKGILAIGGINPNTLKQETFDFNQLRSIFSELHERMTELEQVFDRSKVEFYSTEDQADEMAALVIQEMGLNLSVFGTFFLMLNSSELASCTEVAKQGEQAAFGRLSHQHRPGCYRAQKIIDDYSKDTRIKILR